MCPICWATALATYAGLIALSAVAVAGADLWSLVLAAMLGFASLGHRMEWFTMRWEALVALAAVLVARIVYLLVRDRDKLLIARAWRMALAAAYRRCPRRLTGRDAALTE